MGYYRITSVAQDHMQEFIETVKKLMEEGHARQAPDGTIIVDEEGLRRLREKFLVFSFELAQVPA